MSDGKVCVVHMTPRLTRAACLYARDLYADLATKGNFNCFT
jgi:predicted methyltransferase